MSDNRNRTVGEVRHAFSKCGGNLGTDGSVAYLFKKVGQISYPAGSNEEVLMEAALEAGAEDVISYEDGSIDVLTAPDEFLDIKSVLQDKGHAPESAGITMRASTSQKLGLETAQSMLRLLDMLEDLDDVQKVYSNADIPEDVIAQLD
jgi:YebC/PmpR family DNA-binding regulatory protein